MSEHNNQVKHKGHRYEWELNSPVGDAEEWPVRSWERIGSHARLLTERHDHRLIRKLNRLVERDHKEDETVGGNNGPSVSASDEGQPKKRSSRADRLKETGKDSHGRCWYYDDESKQGQKYYFIVGLFKKRDKSKCEVEIVSTGRRVKHLLNKRAMTLLLKQVSGVFRRCYGEKEMRKLLFPDSTGNQ